MVDRDSIAERFWPKVKRGPGCWQWLASTTKGGYGQFGIYALRRSNFKATHVALWLTTGRWPPAGVDVCHTCDNPACVNTDHLFLGSRRDNMRDAAAKHRTQQGARHWNARLTADKVANIRALSTSGVRNCDIARRLSIPARMVSRVVTRQRWAHEDAQ